LKSMPHGKFREYVVHAVEKYRRDELKLKEQDKYNQRKLAQLQLEELQWKQKVKNEATEQVLPPSAAVNSTKAVVTQPPCSLHTPLPIQSPPVVTVYLQPSHTQYSEGQVCYRPCRGFSRGAPGGQKSKGGCWACGEPGHFANNCLRARGNSNNQHDRGLYLQHGARGPADPLVSPNFDY